MGGSASRRGRKGGVSFSSRGDHLFSNRKEGEEKHLCFGREEQGGKKFVGKGGTVTGRKGNIFF